jgi:hypothetical protein
LIRAGTWGPALMFRLSPANIFLFYMKGRFILPIYITISARSSIASNIDHAISQNGFFIG